MTTSHSGLLFGPPCIIDEDSNTFDVNVKNVKTQ